MYRPSEHPFFRLQCADNSVSAHSVHAGTFSRHVDTLYNEFASGSLVNASIARFETTDAVAFVLYADGVPTMFTELSRSAIQQDIRESQAFHVIESVARELADVPNKVTYLSPDSQLPVATI